MFCTACGFSMSDEHRYCARCGKPVSDGQYQWGAPPKPAPAKRLERNMYDSKIAGVCSGFAQYLGIDVTVMRLIWLGLAVFTGTTLLLYPLCWLVMPRNDYRALPAPAYQQN